MVLLLPAMLPAAASQVRYHYRPECEAVVNSRATLELHASFQCQARACSLHHHQDMALQHFSRFFLLRSQEHSEMAESLMFLQNQRGGRISFLDIRMSETQEQERGLQAMQDALHLEKSVSQSLLDLHYLATESSDAHLCHFLETRHLDQQLESIKELGDHLTNLHKMGTPEGCLAEYIIDKLTWAPVTRTEPVLDFPMSSG
ncbi:ferritin heavy chain-like [Budorcas taxicolor]|uniref:ferritin heavy chain-like n=1 Tax=Budorcas taxicolor TaxID=37181 RepID=UPI00228482C2|nr:ferritin heavy chain-like [Budorcas taxicolor]